MKKMFVMACLLLAFTACKKEDAATEPDVTTPEVTNPEEPVVVPEEPTDQPSVNLDTSFVRKHLIEEFTSQSCGYCPYGMNFVSDFAKDDTTLVVVLHHAGYADDNYTIEGSKQIVNLMGVNSAPSMDIDRVAYTLPEDGTVKIFHPYRLSEWNVDLAQTTYASVDLQSEYDAATRQVQVSVSGVVALEQIPDLRLTVLVKESGMIGVQADYLETYNGWTTFRHVRAARVFLTAALGDALTVTDNRYAVDLNTVIDGSWDADNCTVIAYLTTADNEVIQVNQTPVVSGTQGGEDLEHEGLTAVPLPDNYPEPSDGKGPLSYSKTDTIVLPSAQASYTQENGMYVWTIFAVDGDATITAKNVKTVPAAQFYVYTSTANLSNGTYPINTTQQTNTVQATLRNDHNGNTAGSQFYLLVKTLYKKGDLSPFMQWMMTDGMLVIEEDAWVLTTHSYAGAEYVLKGSTIEIQ